MYAVLGSSRQLSVGPESTTALMTAAAIGGMAAGDPDRYAAAAAALALVVGGLLPAGRVVLRLGFVADLLSRPVLIGYLAGVAVLMITGQLGTVTGVALDADDPVGQVREVLAKVDQVQLAPLTVALLVTVGLLVAHRYAPAVAEPAHRRRAGRRRDRAPRPRGARHRHRRRR